MSLTQTISTPESDILTIINNPGLHTWMCDRHGDIDNSATCLFNANELSLDLAINRDLLPTYFPIIDQHGRAQSQYYTEPYFKTLRELRKKFSELRNKTASPVLYYTASW